MSRRLILLGAVLVVAGTIAVPTAAIGGSSVGAGVPSAKAAAPADFNGDHIADLAVGVPGETVNGLQFAGGVNVFYGTHTGLSAAKAQLWTRAGAVPGSPTQESFGRTVAAGDFDGDGFSDLAVGAPVHDVGSIADVGAVVVLYGSSTGLTATGAQSFTETAFGETLEPSDAYGSALAAGDFDGDGRSDLAVAGSEETRGSVAESGAVGVLYGSASGLQTNSQSAQVWTQKKAGSANHQSQQWGKALSAGQLGHGNDDDLAIGAPGNPHASTVTPSFTILYGTAGGLSATNATEITDSTSNTSQFGAVLAVGDFGGTAEEDLAVAATGRTVGGHPDAGRVLVFYGSSTGPSNSHQTWTRDSPGVPGAAGDNDSFGFSLAAANLGKTAQDDLAIGTLDTVGAVTGAGSVTILYGASGGLTSTGSVRVTQNSGDFRGSATHETYFGYSLAGGNYGNGSTEDLAIGTPYRTVTGQSQAGAAWIAFGGSGGLALTGTQYWTQDEANVPGTAQALDNFARALR